MERFRSAGGRRAARRRPANGFALVVAVLVAALSTSTGSSWAIDAPTAPEGARVDPIERPAEPIPDQYIVTLNGPDPAGDVRVQALSLTEEYGGELLHTYSAALSGFNVRMSEAQAQALSEDPAVASVVQDGLVHLDDSQSPAPWGLDRIDQRDRPADGSYSYASDGSVTTVYVIDSGIRTTHVDFEGRAYVGADFVGDGFNGQDCNGHGTHVASTVGGRQFGVAKNVYLVSVRAMNCSGTGTSGQVIAAIDWVTAHHGSPAVANMSIGGPANSAVDSAVESSIASGVAYVVAAGNANADACDLSPARTPGAITVAATDATDTRASFSNYGVCVDLFAPGVGVMGAGNTSNTATSTKSGTSMASPHVAGAAATYLNSNPGVTPAQVRAALINNATTGHVVNPGPGSPNALEFVGFIGSPPPYPILSRIFGQDAIDTSLAISRAMFGGGAASAVVLARSDHFADALAGGPLAAAKLGPLLITPGAGIRADIDLRVQAEIQRVLPSGRVVYVLGGHLALSPNIDAALEARGYVVVRVQGLNQFATAVAIADQLGNPSVVFEATGLDFADALSAVPAAIQARAAILLTSGNVQAPETAEYLAAHPLARRYAIGGPLAAAGADPSATPVYGHDLFETSAAVAHAFFPYATTVGTATGFDFPDALSGGVFMGARGRVGPVLLVTPSSPLPNSIVEYLTPSTHVAFDFLFGGPLAVSDAVASELGNL